MSSAANRERRHDHADRDIDMEKQADSDADEARLRNRFSEVGHAIPTSTAPRGAAMIARPTRPPAPARETARSRRLPWSDGRGCREFAAVEGVGVVVVVTVDSEGAGGLGTEQAHVLGMLGDGFGTPEQQMWRLRHKTRSLEAMTTCRSCETRSTPNAALVTQSADEGVEVGFPRVVDAANRFVENQEVGGGGQRAGEQHALQFGAGKFGQLLIEAAFGATSASSARKASRDVL